MDKKQIISFNGKEYRLMGSGKYYLSQSTSNAGRRGAKGLHVAVWENHNKQSILPGCQVHHKDGDTFNNEPENLEALVAVRHLRGHHDPNDPKFKKFLKCGQDAAKAWHASPEGRAWHAKHAREMAENAKEHSLLCKECGSEFKSKRKNRAFCSDKCGEHWRGTKRRLEYSGTCEVCSSIFTATKYKASAKERTTCSKVCANKLNHVKRKRD